MKVSSRICCDRKMKCTIGGMKDGEKGVWYFCMDCHREVFVTLREATADVPTEEDFIMWLSEGWAEATDGCAVEPDGVCSHGCRSWLIEFGMI